MAFMFKKRELVQFSQDRLATSLLIAFFLSTVVLFILALVNVHVSDVQVPIRYSGYGITNVYRDKWYTLLAFGVFGLIVFGANGYVAIKIHSARRGLSLGILSISLLIGVIALVVANAVFRLAAFSL